MSGDRWRLVERQDEGPEHVHSVVLSEEEAREHLLLEAHIHGVGGWSVTIGLNLEGEPDVVVLRSPVLKGGKRTERVITVRRFTALEDVSDDELGRYL